jgi:DNA-binding NarL/FixJ family response regulator
MDGGWACPPNGLRHDAPAQNAQMAVETSVLVAVESARVREALVAMIGALDGFHIVAEVDNDEAAIDAARTHRPRLALIEVELSGCHGLWTIQQIRTQGLAGVVVALGRRADNALAAVAGARTYLQMGTSPRDLQVALEAAMAASLAIGRNGSGAEAEGHLLPDANAVL